MTIKKLRCENDRDERLLATYKDSLLASLKGTVFHITSEAALDLIKKSGAIEHNKGKRFKLNTNSEMSFGRLMGWVCLFDLRHATPELITDTLNSYNFFLPPGDLGREISNVLAYLILDSTYFDRLIPYELHNNHVRKTGQYPMAIPKVETWIADKVPLTWIKKVILASIGEILTEEQIQRRQGINEAYRNLKWGQD